MEQTNSLKGTARLAGLLYLIWILTGIYALVYVHNHTLVVGDAAATVRKILANELIFRTGVVNDIFSSAVWVLIGLTFYQLFKQVNERQAKLLVAFVIVQVPVAFFMEALNLTTLMICKGDLLKSYELSQRQDMAMMFLKITDNGAIALEMFWGLWLFPLGLLVYRSGFIPKILGVFLVLNGIAYVIHFLSHVLLPDYQELVFKLATPFWILGEISITIWLLIKGVKDTP